MEFRLTIIQLTQLAAESSDKVAKQVALPVGNSAEQVGKTGGSHLTLCRQRLNTSSASSCFVVNLVNSFEFFCNG